MNLQTIKLKKQRHAQGCGLACVAMIAKKTYNNVIDDFWFRNEDTIFWKYINDYKTWVHDYGTNTIDLHELLNDYGVESNERCVPYKGRDKLPDLSILVTYKRKETIDGKRKMCWHWVVCKKEGRNFKVLDPWFGEQTLKDCGKITSYIRIHT